MRPATKAVLWTALLAGIGSSVVVSFSRMAESLPVYSRLYQRKYAYRASCELCHISGGGSAINDYGRDFLRGGANLGALAKIEKKDSDGDGASNIEEIRQKANPGDARSTPDKPGRWLDEAETIFIPVEQLKKLFPSADSFAGIEGTLNEHQVSSVEKRIGVALSDEDKVPTFYFAIKRGKRYAVAQFVSVSSPKSLLSVAVAMDAKGVVSGVKILKNPASKAIEAATFLSQFEGKKLGDPVEIGKDLKAAEGEEALSQAVALAVRKAIAIISAVFGR